MYLKLGLKKLIFWCRNSGTQEEAAEAYDVAAIKFRGVNAVTNFNISRYDVEKIMASNTLPSGDIARRNKEREMAVQETAMEHNITAQSTDEVCAQVENIRNGHDWKMLLHNPCPQHQENVTVESLNVKTMNLGNYQSTSFSVALHDLISIASSQTVVDESTTPVAQHFSNPSSMVTSLSSSREASPDRNGGPFLFAKPNNSNTLISPSSNVNSWTQLRAVPLATTHLPILASWNDV